MSNNIDELPEGGMGIKIMSQIADELSYTRTPTQRNCLLIVKNYQQQCLEQSHAPPKTSVLSPLIEFFNYLKGVKDKVYRYQLHNSLIQKIHLQVNTDLNELDQILQWFNQVELLPISKILWCQCQLALVEGFTNAVRHAHKGLPLETPIELEVTVFKECLKIRIWDYGQPYLFDPNMLKLRRRKLRLRDVTQRFGHLPKGLFPNKL
jgi:serine/threonine-protein kinase RsbW